MLRLTLELYDGNRKSPSKSLFGLEDEHFGRMVRDGQTDRSKGAFVASPGINTDFVGLDERLPTFRWSMAINHRVAAEGGTAANELVSDPESGICVKFSKVPDTALGKDAGMNEDIGVLSILHFGLKYEIPVGLGHEFKPPFSHCGTIRKDRGGATASKPINAKFAVIT